MEVQSNQVEWAIWEVKHIDFIIPASNNYDYFNNCSHKIHFHRVPVLYFARAISDWSTDRPHCRIVNRDQRLCYNKTLGFKCNAKSVPFVLLQCA